MGEAVLIKEVDFDNEPIEVATTVTKPESVKIPGGNAAAAAASQSQFASATSLLQLSQQTKAAASIEAATAAGQETVLLSTDSVIQIPGQEGEYVLVTTDDDEQKFMPISHLTSLIANATSSSSASAAPASSTSS